MTSVVALLALALTVRGLLVIMIGIEEHRRAGILRGAAETFVFGLTFLLLVTRT